MSWLLYLYPPSWRKRYRREVAAHLHAEPMRIRTVVDLMAGAIDEWLNTGSFPNESDAGEERIMIKVLRCESRALTRGDAVRSAGWMLGTTLALTILALALQKTLGDHVTIEALLLSAFFIALTVSSQKLYLRPYSRAARAILIGVATLLQGCITPRAGPP